MIPATSFQLNDDGTAWCVLANHAKMGGWPWWMALDRPCDTCGGDLDLAEPEGDCTDCIDGRHTFTVEVEPFNAELADAFNLPFVPITHRVSVVPGMVLPIVEEAGSKDIPGRVVTYNVQSGLGGSVVRTWLWDGLEARESITLPPDARPGMWAVLVKMAS
jgi:hypothetical protein